MSAPAGAPRLNLAAEKRVQPAMRSTKQSNEATGTVNDDQVVAWRFEQLVAAGFQTELAAGLARECAVDLHRLLALIERGSTPELAARILMPLDGEQHRC